MQTKLNIVERVIRATRVTVVADNITNLEVDAIVILRAGGNKIQEEALKKAPISIGKAVATIGGMLKAEYVIHAPTMTRPTSKENARLATKAALEAVRQLGIESIAFPGMGTGVGGLEPQEAADAMVAEIGEHIEAGTPLKQVILVGYNVPGKADIWKQICRKNLREEQ